MPGPDAASKSRVEMNPEPDGLDDCGAAVSPTEPGPRTITSGSLVPDERNKGFEVPPVSCRVVAIGCTAHRGQRRLVHELGGGNSATDGSGIGEQATRLIALPSACCVPGTGARGHRGHDLCVDGVGKVDDSFPAFAAEHRAEAVGRRGGRIIAFSKVGGIGPGAADAHVGRGQRGSQCAQPGVRQVDGLPIRVEVGIRRPPGYSRNYQRREPTALRHSPCRASRTVRR